MRKSWAEVSRSGERWAEVRRWEMRQTEREEEGENWSARVQRQRDTGKDGRRWAHRSQAAEGLRSGKAGKGKEGRENRGLPGAASTREGGVCGVHGAPALPRPQTSLLLLLLLLSPGLQGTPDCSFRHSPISSTFAIKIGKLVSVPVPNPSPRCCLWV